MDSAYPSWSDLYEKCENSEVGYKEKLSLFNLYSRVMKIICISYVDVI